MGTVCRGCQSENRAEGEVSKQNSDHICKCKSQIGQVEIDGRTDQVAASDHDDKRAQSGESGTAAVPDYEALKAEVIQRI